MMIAAAVQQSTDAGRRTPARLFFTLLFGFSADRPLYALGICFVELHERRCMATRRDDIYAVVWRRVARLS